MARPTAIRVWGHQTAWAPTSTIATGNDEPLPPLGISAAGCDFKVHLRGALGRPRKNFLDMTVPDTGERCAAWTVHLEAASLSPAERSWTGSRKRRVLRTPSFEVSYSERSVNVLHDRSLGSTAQEALQTAVFGALRREGRADLHGAAVVPPDATEALLLVGPSGHGKTTLCVLALSAGWTMLSDDILAIYTDSEGALAVAPLRRRLRVSQGTIERWPELASRGYRLRTGDGKTVIDPDRAGAQPRAKAKPGQLVFLERGGAHSVARVSPADAFVRLMSLSPHLLNDPDADPAIASLKRLANETPAAVATLTSDSLHDVTSLESFVAAAPFRGR